MSEKEYIINYSVKEEAKPSPSPTPASNQSLIESDSNISPVIQRHARRATTIIKSMDEMVGNQENNFIDQTIFYRNLKGVFGQSKTLAEKDLGYKQHKHNIEELMRRRLNNEEGVYLEFMEMTPFEKWRKHHDKYPLFYIRKLIWFVKIFLNYLAEKIVTHPLFEYTSLCVIVINSIFLALDDPIATVRAEWLNDSDWFFLIFYTVEMFLKMIAKGLLFNKGAYLRDYWNILDFVIVTTAYIPIFIGNSNSVSLTGLRSLRVLRPLRTISSLKELRSLILTILGAIPQLVQVLVVFLFFVLIFGIAGLQLFSGLFKKHCINYSDGSLNQIDLEPCGNRECQGNSVCGKTYINPNWGSTNFDNLFSSFLMVFVTVTLEGWSDIMRFVQKSFSDFAIPYFILIIFIGAFFLLNLTLAVLMAEYNAEVEKQRKELLFEESQNKRSVILMLAESAEGKKIEPSKKKKKKNTKEVRKGISLHIYKNKAINKFESVSKRKQSLSTSNFQDTLKSNVLYRRTTTKKAFNNNYDDKSYGRPLTLKEYQRELMHQPKIGYSTGLSESLKKQINFLPMKQNNFVNEDYVLLSPAPIEENQNTAKIIGSLNLYNEKKNQTQFSLLPPMHHMIMNENIDGEDLFFQEIEMLKNKQLQELNNNNSYIQNNNIPYGHPILLHQRTSDSYSFENLSANKIGKKFNSLKQATQPQENSDNKINKLSENSFDVSVESEIDSFSESRGSESSDSDHEKFANSNEPGRKCIKRTNTKALTKNTRNLKKTFILKKNLEFDEDFFPYTKKIVPLKEDDKFTSKSMQDILSDSVVSNKIKSSMSLTSQKSSKGSTVDGKIGSPKSSSAVQRFLNQSKLKKRQSNYSRKKNMHSAQHHLSKKNKDLEHLLKMNKKYIKICVCFDKIYNPKDKYNSIDDTIPSKGLREKEKMKEKAEEILKKTKLKMVYQFKPLVQPKEIAADNLVSLRQKNKKGTRIKKQTILKNKNKILESQRLLSQHAQLYDNSTKPFQVFCIPFSYSRISSYLFHLHHGIEPQTQDKNLNAMSNIDLKSVKKKGVINYEKLEDVIEKWNELQCSDSWSKPLHNLKFEELYLSIKAKDFEDKEINNYNNSCTDVLSYKSTYNSKIQRIVFELNSQTIEMWEGGAYGIFQAFRRRILDFLESKPIETFLIVCVLFNTLILALSGLLTEEQENFLENVNYFFTFTFAVEMLLKLIGFGPSGYLRDIFNLFDCLIVILSLVELGYTFQSTGHGGSALSAFRSFRLFRTLRTLRVLRMSRIFRSIKFIKIIIGIISDPVFLEKNFHVTILLFLFIYIFTLIGMQIFGGKFPEDAYMNFDSFLSSFMTVFQVLTTENWNSVLYDGMRSQSSPFVVSSFLISWIFIGNYIFLNLFLGILLDAFGDTMQNKVVEIQHEEEELEKLHKNDNFDDDKNTSKQNKEGENEEEDESKINETLNQPGTDAASLNNSFSSEFSKKSELNKQESISSSNQSSKQVSKDFDATNTFSKSSSKSSAFSSKNQFVVASQAHQFTDEEEQELLIQAQMQKRKHILRKDPYYDVVCNKSLFIFSKSNIIRLFAAKIVSHRYFETAILIIIIMSSVKLVVETYLDSDSTNKTQIIILDTFDVIDYILNTLFCIESLLKILKYGFVFCPSSYLRDSWSILDFIIVVSSLIDMMVADLNFGFLKIVRMLRTLRPLRFISHNDNMKVLVSALVESISGILNVFIVIFFVWLIFGILGVSLLGDKMSRCSIPEPYNISKTACEELAYNVIHNITHDEYVLQQLNGSQNASDLWVNAKLNFDNIINSMITLFVISSLEGWPDIWKNAMDANDDTVGPLKNKNIWVVFFFAFFVLLSSYFLMNLFVAVIFYQYNEEQRIIVDSRYDGFNQEQRNWIIMQPLIQRAKPLFSLTIAPTNKIRAFVYHIINHAIFDTIIMIFIILNIVTMAMTYDGSSDTYDTVLKNINLTFTCVFIAECILKLFSMGPKQYFYNRWNQFDFFIVLTSIIDILMDLMGQNFISFLRAGPQLARVLRVLRVSRLFKLMKSKKLDSINKIIQTLIFSLPPLINVVTLLGLIYFIFAVLGVFLFKTATYDEDYNNSYTNFHNFGQSFLTLFRCSTGENWPSIMKSYSSEISPGFIGYLFFMSFIVLSSFVMLNMFVLIVIQEFQTYYISKSNPLVEFSNYLQDFREVWNIYTVKTKGTKIYHTQLMEFFTNLEEPLGIIITFLVLLCQAIEKKTLKSIKMDLPQKLQSYPPYQQARKFFK